MEYRRLGRTGLQVSSASLGALEIGRDWGIQIEGDFGRPEESDAVALVHRALDLGINFIDTAPAYQLSEARLGKALHDRRDEVYLATKVGEHYSDQDGFSYDLDPTKCRASIEQSLRRLNTDVIDLLQIHSASVEVIREGTVFEVMQRFQEAGHVRYLGVTGGNDAAVAAIEDGHYDTVQIVYNLIQQDARTSVFPLARERDIGVIVMVPLGHGAFTRKWEYLEPEQRVQAEQFRWLERPGQSLAAAALRFVLADPVVSTAIPGTRKLANLEANVAAAADHLTDEELAQIVTSRP